MTNQTIKDIAGAYNGALLRSEVRTWLMDVVRHAAGTGAVAFNCSIPLTKVDRGALEEMGFRLEFNQDGLFYTVFA